jgi:hypothetical protein
MARSGAASQNNHQTQINWTRPPPTKFGAKTAWPVEMLFNAMEFAYTSYSAQFRHAGAACRRWPQTIRRDVHMHGGCFVNHNSYHIIAIA